MLRVRMPLGSVDFSSLTYSVSCIQYWDQVQQKPVAEVSLPERCYTMDLAYPLLVVATAERNVITINLSNPVAIVKVTMALRSCGT